MLLFSLKKPVYHLCFYAQLYGLANLSPRLACTITGPRCLTTIQVRRKIYLFSSLSKF